ncbi:hypothetical protein CAPTEDRAFT_216115 [Capitella teleta]|uniref:Uncharacterized protein n=1 Tax=Capitella teleta TaxID=283909 RepID=R7VGW4_CAPTE|nr:hypothetical protein CAPTEDRAFT_216115 [Capitella teleta]|eukprot:ELU17849.1 hypothetical protein CAPTEDRAFT_216115 [Capitella teleta]
MFTRRWVKCIDTIKATKDKKRRGAENLSTFMDDVMPTPQCKENIEAAVAHPLQMLAEKKALTKENKTLKRKLEATADECQENETQEQTEQVLKICFELEFVSCYCAGIHKGDIQHGIRSCVR